MDVEQRVADVFVSFASSVAKVRSLYFGLNGVSIIVDEFTHN